jgi:hypothetical protein
MLEFIITVDGAEHERVTYQADTCKAFATDPVRMANAIRSDFLQDAADNRIRITGDVVVWTYANGDLVTIQ